MTTPEISTNGDVHRTECHDVITAAKEAINTPLSAIPPTLPQICQQLHTKIHAFLDTPPKSEAHERTQNRTRESLKVVEKALTDYTFDELAISYNGGKDCLVLLLLFLCALHEHSPTAKKIHSVYVMSAYPFAEVDEFVNTSVREYSLDLHRYALPMKDAFATYLKENKKGDEEGIKAIFVGTRRTDPHGEKLHHFDRTDHGWPDFMRIQPVIDWGYQDVWTFLRELEVEYCSLYDLGYTSLGGMTDTEPNPNLLDPSSTDGVKRYRPAYELLKDEDERLGRNKR